MRQTEHEEMVARMERLASWVDAPNTKGHPYSTESEAEFGDDPEAARTPAVMALMDAGFVAEYLDRVVPQLVAYARSDGETWQQIGETMGLTRQATQQKYGR